MEVRLFQRREPLVEAVLVTPENLAEVAKWVGTYKYSSSLENPSGGCVQVPTNTVWLAYVGDWVLRLKESGRFEVRPGNKFMLEYEVVQS